MPCPLSTRATEGSWNNRAPALETPDGGCGPGTVTGGANARRGPFATPTRARPLAARFVLHQSRRNAWPHRRAGGASHRLIPIRSARTFRTRPGGHVLGPRHSHAPAPDRLRRPATHAVGVGSTRVAGTGGVFRAGLRGLVPSALRSRDRVHRHLRLDRSRRICTVPSIDVPGSGLAPRRPVRRRDRTLVCRHQ